MRIEVGNIAASIASTTGVRFGDFVEGHRLSRNDLYLRGSAAIDIEALAIAARDAKQDHSGSGLYLYWMARDAQLGELTMERYSVVYVGMTDDCLSARNHLTAKHSGFSTLRRTLGALLRQELGLRAQPRSLGSSLTNSRNYRFDQRGEACPTSWMTRNLKVASIQAKDRLRDRERALISELVPTLNLTGWANPDRVMIKRERLRCAIEAAL